jgi:hypothetical protein
MDEFLLGHGPSSAFFWTVSFSIICPRPVRIVRSDKNVLQRPPSRTEPGDTCRWYRVLFLRLKHVRGSFTRFIRRLLVRARVHRYGAHTVAPPSFGSFGNTFDRCPKTIYRGSLFAQLQQRSIGHRSFDLWHCNLRVSRERRANIFLFLFTLGRRVLRNALPTKANGMNKCYTVHATNLHTGMITIRRCDDTVPRWPHVTASCSRNNATCTVIMISIRILDIVPRADGVLHHRPVSTSHRLWSAQEFGMEGGCHK